jgi:hypothetical protein
MSLKISGVYNNPESYNKTISVLISIIYINRLPLGGGGGISAAGHYGVLASGLVIYYKVRLVVVNRTKTRDTAVLVFYIRN